jgi:hypothetical protein
MAGVYFLAKGKAKRRQARLRRSGRRTPKNRCQELSEAIVAGAEEFEEAEVASSTARETGSYKFLQTSAIIANPHPDGTEPI